MKLMQNGLFIDKIWAKIAVGTLSYRWNSILVVGSTRAWTGPSDHIGERSDISPKNRRYITEKSTINWHHRWFSIKIADLSTIYHHFFGIFCKISLLRFFFTKCRVAHSRYTIYRRYIIDISRHFPPWVNHVN